MTDSFTLETSTNLYLSSKPNYTVNEVWVVTSWLRDCDKTKGNKGKQRETKGNSNQTSMKLLT